MNKKIIILSGDPNSVNSELIYKSWKKLNKPIRRKIILISNYNLLSKQFKKLKYSIGLVKINKIDQNEKDNSLKILNIDLNFKDPFKVKKKSASSFIRNSLNLAHKIALDKRIKGIVNCAVNKNLLNKDNIGVTEYLAKKCNIINNTEVMLIRGDKLSVVPLTIHIKLKDVTKKIRKKLIIKKISSLVSNYKKIFKKKPKIGMLGLNPHNAEMRDNSEEKKIIKPSILSLKRKGINISGPLIADTIFIKDYKNYDIIVGMYHDQILGPFKSIFKFNAINVTLGLKYLRVSPDHGTAKNIIGKKIANPTSLIM